MIDAIIEISIQGSAAADKRRSELIRTVKTLDDLKIQMQKLTFDLKRDTAYRRLIPKRALSQEDKRHVNTAPIKLTKCQNSKHSKHADTMFARRSIHNLETLAGLLGPNETVFLSQDDKAKVPLGIAAANKQAPLLMHLEYQVRLADHDFVVA